MFEAKDRLTAVQSMMEGTGPGGDLRKFSKPKMPLLLSVLVGKQTPVLSMIRERGIRMKEDYHKFRYATMRLTRLNIC